MEEGKGPALTNVGSSVEPFLSLILSHQIHLLILGNEAEEGKIGQDAHLFREVLSGERNFQLGGPGLLSATLPVHFGPTGISL